MSSSFGINLFGTLTVGRKQATFDQLDTDNDGKITKEEFCAFCNENGIDDVELTTINKDNNKEISEDEFKLYEQKIEMQKAVNALKATVSKDFSGSYNSKLIAELNIKLAEYVNEFINGYTGETENLAAAFKETLPTKYEEIKAEVLVNSAENIESTVLDNVYAQIVKAKDSVGGSAAEAIQKELIKAADAYVKTYSGDDLVTDLTAYLNEYMNVSDKAKLADDVKTWDTKKTSFGDLIDSNELKTLKEYAKTLLQAAVAKGITIKLGSTNIATEAAITSALNKYSDGKTLIADLDDAINNLSEKTKVEKLIEEAKAGDIAAANKLFTEIPGSEYAINAATIDYSVIPKYFKNERPVTNGRTGSTGIGERLHNEYKEAANTIKPQMKEQIVQMLLQKGVADEKIQTVINNVFENIYNTTLNEYVNSIGNHKTKAAAIAKNKRFTADVGMKDFIDTFITKFNENFVAAINDMNASDEDMDTIDLNFAVAGNQENGEPIIDEASGEDLSTLYAKGETITVKGHGKDYFVSIAENMIENMRSQMEMKARIACEANGIEFDAAIFETMFNNAKSAGIAAGVSGEPHNSGDRSRSRINAKILLDTFTENFKQNYTAWVEEEKAKTK